MRFIHIADVHLGMMPDINKPWGKYRKQEIWDSFEAVIELAKEKNIDFLFIAGDLFHKQPLLRELKEVNYLFSTLEKTKVVLIAGNHDYIRTDSYYDNFEWDEHVIFLKNETMEKVEIGNICVYGFSYHQKENREFAYHDIAIQDKDKINILLGHGGDETHCPYRLQDLQKLGFQYLAFGHIHKPMICSDFPMANVGSLEPLTVNETGKHGYIEGEIDEETKVCNFKFIPFAKREYIEWEVESTKEDTALSMRDKIRDFLTGQNKENIYKIRILGQRSENVEYDPQVLQALGNLLIEDESKVVYDYAAIYKRNQENLLGLYLKKFDEMESTEITERAKYLGTKALLDALEEKGDY